MATIIERVQARRAAQGPSIPLLTAQEVRRQPVSRDRSFWRRTIPLSFGKDEEAERLPILGHVLESVRSRARQMLADQAAQREEEASRQQDIQTRLQVAQTILGQQRRSEELQGRYNDLQMEELIAGFMPRNPSSLYTQAAAFRGQGPIDSVMEDARRAEGIANVREFSRVAEGMDPEARASLTPIAQSLAKSGLQPEDFLDLIEKTRKYGPDSREIYGVNVDKRKQFNRVVGDLAGVASDPRDRFNIVLPTDDEDKGFRGDFVEGFRRGIGETAGRVVGPVQERVLDPIFEREQQVFQPVSRKAVEAVGEQFIPVVAIKEGLNALGLNPVSVDQVAEYVSPFLVPSSALGFGYGGGAKATKLLKLQNAVKRAVSEGLLNVQQEGAHRSVSGLPEMSDEETALIFMQGAVVGAGAPELLGVVGNRLKSVFRERGVGQAIKVMPEPRIGEVEPALHGAMTEPAAIREIIVEPPIRPLERSQVRVGDTVALIGDPNTPIGVARRKMPGGVIVEASDGTTRTVPYQRALPVTSVEEVAAPIAEAAPPLVRAESMVEAAPPTRDDVWDTAQTGIPIEGWLHRGSEGIPPAEPPFYLSPNRDLAVQFGPQIASSRVRFTNPLVLTQRDAVRRGGTETILDSVRQQGYDALILKGPRGRVAEVVDLSGVSRPLEAEAVGGTPPVQQLAEAAPPTEPVIASSRTVLPLKDVKEARRLAITQPEALNDAPDDLLEQAWRAAQKECRP